MRRLLGLLAAAALLPPAAAQAAESARMAEFRSLCVQTRADVDKVEALADKGGWKAGPPGSDAKGDGITKAITRQIDDSGGLRMLIAGRGDAPGGLKGDFCALIVHNAGAGFLKEVVDLAGVPPSNLVDDHSVQAFAYTEEGGVKKSQAHLSAEALAGLAARQPVYVFMLGESDSQAMAVFAVLGPKPA
ncbi:MAG TPA: hypothetical protein VEA44_01695 [Caulobacter sp.]|nr:hypothetical protein [Caulobacter sp.]